MTSRSKVHDGASLAWQGNTYGKKLLSIEHAIRTHLLSIYYIYAYAYTIIYSII